MADIDLEGVNKQVLADTFRNLVRYALRKTRRDVEKFGVTPGSFSIKAMDASFAACANAGLFAQQFSPSIGLLLEKAHQRSLIFHFSWISGGARESFEAGFDLSYEPDGDLKVRLLWLRLPEHIPISPSEAVAGGPRPLDEAVVERLRILQKGRLAPYAPPT